MIQEKSGSLSEKKKNAKIKTERFLNYIKEECDKA
jgi:hypothetical protein